MDRRVVSVNGDDEIEMDGDSSGKQLLMSKFEFIPLHYSYLYHSGGDVARTVIVFVINLPSGCGPDRYNVKVRGGGTILELEVKWPDYLVNPKLLNGK